MNSITVRTRSEEILPTLVNADLDAKFSSAGIGLGYGKIIIYSFETADSIRKRLTGLHKLK